MATPDPDLGVVIVNWNTRDLLNDCLTSVAEARGPTRKVVVVDNGSSDGSVEVVQRHPAVKVITNSENLGFARACNQGLSVIKARYVLLLNPDTRVNASALEEMVAFMDAHPRAGACGPRLLNPDGTLQPSGRAFPTLWRAMMAMTPLPRSLRRATEDDQVRREYDRICQVDEISGAAQCLRAAALDQVGALDERFFLFGEDIDLCWRLRKAGWTIHYIPRAVVTHVWGASRQGAGEWIQIHAQRSGVLLMRKHRSPTAAGVITAYALLMTLARMARRAIPTRWRGAGAASRALTWRNYWSELVWLFRA